MNANNRNDFIEFQYLSVRKYCREECSNIDNDLQWKRITTDEEK